MLSNEVWPDVAAKVSAGDFYDPKHQLIFEAMATLSSNGQPLDPVSVCNILEERQTLIRAGGIAYLADLVENTPSARNATHYAQIVSDRAARRNLMAGLQQIVREASNPDGEPIDRLLRLTAHKLDSVRHNLPADKVATKYCDLTNEKPIDWLVANLIYRGGVFLFVGQPKTGKSTALRTLAAVMASGGGHFLRRTVADCDCVFVDFENPSEVARTQWDKLARRGNRAGLPRLWLALNARTLPGSAMSIVEAAARQVTEVEGNDLGMVVVDGLAALIPSGTERGNDGGYTQMGNLIGRLRSLSERHNCAVVVQHHAGKQDASQPLGSTAIAGQVDTVVAFERKDGLPVSWTIKTGVMRAGKSISTNLTLDSATGTVGLPATRRALSRQATIERMTAKSPLESTT